MSNVIYFKYKNFPSETVSSWLKLHNLSQIEIKNENFLVLFGGFLGQRNSMMTSNFHIAFPARTGSSWIFANLMPDVKVL